MRLLNTSNLSLEEYVGSQIPKYAILSHRWEYEEYTYKDSQDSEGIESILAGYAKVKGCCMRAARDGHQYVWVDSCCIDKSSSAELSEAINSMFKWYRNSEVCYIYLSDVPDANAEHRAPQSAFRRSKWFTRGWTLQELLAPKKLEFFDRNWNRLPWIVPARHGFPQFRLESLISEITGIKDLKNYEKCSVAQKMSWASKRETTREEDLAYCLLGLFGVNMPPLYGEGEKAFLRLQLEILKMSDDESIFAWTTKSNVEGGLLASSPAEFKDSGNVEMGKWDSPSYTMTNKGLHISFRLIKHWNNLTKLAANEALLAPLNCHRSNQLGQIAVLLRQVNKDQYIRTLSHRLVTMRDLPNEYQSTPQTSLYVRQYDTPPQSEGKYLFSIPIQAIDAVISRGYRISEKYVSHPGCSQWTIDRMGQYMLMLEKQDACGALMFRDEQNASFVLVVDVRMNCPGVAVFIAKGQQDARAFCDMTKDTPRRDHFMSRLPGGESLVVTLKERGIFSKHEYAIGLSTRPSNVAVPRILPNPYQKPGYSPNMT